MSTKDVRRIEVLNRVLAGSLTLVEAAPLLGVGERQARRLLTSYQEEGPSGLVHGNRGRRPAHAVPDDLCDRIRALAGGAYAGVNHTHLAELLAEREGIDIPRSTLSRILREGGLRSPRPQKRRSRHRSRRDRYPQEGMLLQVDASHHAWLEQRGPRLVLLAAIDDATGKVAAARFHGAEDSQGYFLLMRDLCRKTGVPRALYTDKHSVFWPTASESLQEQLKGRRSPTQFGRAMTELGVELIAAHSPQAKGRVERLWGTLQDRLVSELRLADVTTMEDANRYLAHYLPRFNRTFAITAETPGSAYGPRLKTAGLDQFLCFKHDRVVARDNTVRVDQVVLQLLPGPGRLGYSKATVTIHETLAHRFSVHYEGRVVPSRILTLKRLLTPPSAPPKRRPPTQPPQAPPAPVPQPSKPPASHPWRIYPAVTKSLVT